MIKQLLTSKQQHSNTQSPQTLCDRHTRLKKKIETKKKLKKKSSKYLNLNISKVYIFLKFSFEMNIFISSTSINTFQY